MRHARSPGQSPGASMTRSMSDRRVKAQAQTITALKDRRVKAQAQTGSPSQSSDEGETNSIRSPGQSPGAERAAASKSRCGVQRHPHPIRSPGQSPGANGGRSRFACPARSPGQSPGASKVYKSAVRAGGEIYRLCQIAGSKPRRKQGKQITRPSGVQSHRCAPHPRSVWYPPAWLEEGEVEIREGGNEA